MSNPSPALTSHSSLTPPTTADRKTDLPLLTRTRLLQRIKRALQKGNLFVAAPAGYGKSTLLRSLIVQQPDSIYIALSPTDADLSVLQACLLPVLPHASMIVLDDAHHLVDATETLAWLVERLQSATPSWVISGRSIPAPLITDPSPNEQLGMADLAFGASESKAILRGFDERLVGEWRQRTEGWPLALALLARQTPEKFALTTATTSDELFAYLAESVFGALPTELAEFMQISALPLRFNDELLATVFDHPVAEVAALRQEVQQRNLFIEPLETQGWFKVHDFVRHYLYEQVNPVWRAEVAERIVTWFETTGDLRMAVEQAIDGQLYERAAQIMKTQGNTLLFELGWHQSYKRWIFAMPESMQARYPNLLARLGFALIYLHQSVDEGVSYVTRAQSLIDRTDVRMAGEVSVHAAGAYTVLRESEKALLLIATAQTYPDLPLRSQILLWTYRASNYGHLYRLRDVRHAYKMATLLVEQLEQQDERENLLALIRHNRGTQLESIRGDFSRFEQTLHLNKVFDSDKLAALEVTYTGFCVLHENLGDWQALVEDLRQIKTARLQQGVDSDNEQTEYQMTVQWEVFYWAVFYVGVGDFSAAQSLINHFAATVADPVADPEAIACGQWLQVWKLRCQQRYADCISFVDTLAPATSDAANFYRAAIAFERAAAALFANHTDWQAGVEPHLRFHMQIGAKHYLLRWRILFALGCVDDGHSPTVYRPSSTVLRPPVHRRPFHKHVIFALCAIRRYGYDRLLIQREPELAAHFWTLCLAENIQPETALAALKEIGRVEPISNLLLSQSRQEEDKETR